MNCKRRRRWGAGAVEKKNCQFSDLNIFALKFGTHVAFLDGSGHLFLQLGAQNRIITVLIRQMLRLGNSTEAVQRRKKDDGLGENKKAENIDLGLPMDRTISDPTTLQL